MCYAVSLEKLTPDEIIELYEGEYDREKFQNFYYTSAFPRKTENQIQFSQLPIITRENPKELQFYNWGMVLPYIKEPLKVYESLSKYPTYNAKGEEMANKRTFASAYKNHQRCLIPITGFYEHQHHNANLKIPYYISLKERNTFCLAGLYGYWHNQLTGEKVGTFTIITTAANPMMAKIHNSKKRMPVIISRNEHDTWLDPDTPTTLLEKLIAPYPDSEMQAHTIARKPYNHPLVAEKLKYTDVDIDFKQ